MSSSVQVPLSDICPVSLGELEQYKLKALENGSESFERILASASNPIALNRGNPHDVANGRHRIYIARKKGMKTVPAIFV